MKSNINKKVQHIKTKYPITYENYFKRKSINNNLSKTKNYFRTQKNHDRRLSHIYEYYLRNNILRKNVIAYVEKNNKKNPNALKNNKSKATSYKISRKIHENKYSRLDPVTTFINEPLNVKLKQYDDRIPQTSYKTLSYHRSTKIYHLNYNQNSNKLQKLKDNIAQESNYSDESKWIKLNLYKALRYGGRKFDAFHKRDKHFNKYYKIDSVSSHSDEETVLKSNIYKVFQNISQLYK